MCSFSFIYLCNNKQGDVIICGKKRHGLVSDEDIEGLHIGLVHIPCALLHLY
jgi:hypothetical protein